MAYAYLTVRIPIADHTFVQTPQNAKGLLEQIFRRDPRTMGCVVEVAEDTDKTTYDRKLEAVAWAEAQDTTEDVVDEEYVSVREPHRYKHAGNIFENGRITDGR